MSVVICPRCGHLNPQSTAYCEHCWTALQATHPDVRRTTQVVSAVPVDAPVVDRGQAQIKKTAHVGKLAPQAIAIYVENLPEPLIVSLISQVILGRAIPTEVQIFQTLVDLSPFDARDKGVSRQHCTLRRTASGILVQDVGSSNGTRLHGVLLSPLQPTLIASGAQLQLGQLELQIFLP